jgi:hypothetical protein
MRQRAKPMAGDHSFASGNNPRHADLRANQRPMETLNPAKVVICQRMPQ